MDEPSDRERIDDLEVAGRVQDERLSGLELSTLGHDERLVSLAHETMVSKASSNTVLPSSRRRA
jgi:hypothetical protein